MGGAYLNGSVTSLPELITGISSVAIVKESDLAAGDIFGREGSLFEDISPA